MQSCMLLGCQLGKLRLRENPRSIAGFSFEITTTSSDVSFRDVNYNTQSAPYIFGKNSLFGPDIITSTPGGNTVSADDNYATPNQGATLAEGQTLDLGHVLFALALSAPPMPIQLTFADFPDTGVNSPSGAQYTIVPPAPADSQISVGAAVPEPASVLLGPQGLLLAGYIIRRARRGARG